MNAAVRRRDDEDAGSGRRPRPAEPRNFLAPGERRRLFWIVMPAGMLLVLGLGWVERAWSSRRAGGGRPQVDTRLEAVAGPTPTGGEVRFERDPEPLAAAPAAELAADAAALARVRDATVFREADNEAWFQVWNTLRDADAATFRAARPRDVSFRELFGQPRSFRGRLVRMRGTLHRAERLAAPPNDYGVEHYWQCWMEPLGGPPSPVVIQCLALPEGMPTGMAIAEPVDVTGCFFKNFAYNAADAIRVAPVIMTVQPTWRPVTRRPPRGLAGPGGVTLVLAAALAAVVAAAWLGSIAGRRRPAVGGPPPVSDLDATLEGFEPVGVEEALRRAAAEADDDGDGRGASRG